LFDLVLFLSFLAPKTITMAPKRTSRQRKEEAHLTNIKGEKKVEGPSHEKADVESWIAAGATAFLQVTDTPVNRVTHRTMTGRTLAAGMTATTAVSLFVRDSPVPSAIQALVPVPPQLVKAPPPPLGSMSGARETRSMSAFAVAPTKAAAPSKAATRAKAAVPSKADVKRYKMRGQCAKCQLYINADEQGVMLHHPRGWCEYCAKNDNIKDEKIKRSL
jgi:hypothetical protein